MQIPVQVTFRDFDGSDAIREECQAEVAKLERIYERITSCRIIISRPTRHNKKGGATFSVHVELELPGGNIHVNREHHEKHAHEDVKSAIKDSFRAARRQLEDFARRQRGDVKVHDTGVPTAVD